MINLEDAEKHINSATPNQNISENKVRNASFIHFYSEKNFEN